MLLYLLILYLACNALLERNRRLRKTVHDFLHDHEVVYHQMRLMRFLVLPVFKFYDLSKFHTTHCIVQNPFKLQGNFLFVTIFIATVTCKSRITMSRDHSTQQKPEKPVMQVKIF